jgi:hypothetical protein
MEHEDEWQVTGPSGTLAQRVGDHVASANQLLQQSRRAVDRLRARTELAYRRIDRTNRRIEEARGLTGSTQRSSAGAVSRFMLVKQRELAPTWPRRSCMSRRPSSRSGWATRGGRPRPAPGPSGRGSGTAWPRRSWPSTRRGLRARPARRGRLAA